MQKNLPSWGSCQRIELFASCWQKVTVFLSSDEGQRAHWIAGVWGGGVDKGVNGWQMFTEVWLHVCGQKIAEGFHFYHQESRSSPSPTCGECCFLLWLKLWASLSASFTLSRWPGCISPRAPAWVGSVWASYTTSPIDFYLSMDRSLTASLLHAVGFLCTPCWSRLFSSFHKPGADRVKAVILESWTRRGGKWAWCTCVRLSVCVWERERERERKRFTVSCPHHSTLEDSSPVAASNINMSSQNYKHMAAGAEDLSGYPVLSCWILGKGSWFPHTSEH